MVLWFFWMFLVNYIIYTESSLYKLSFIVHLEQIITKNSYRRISLRVKNVQSCNEKNQCVKRKSVKQRLLVALLDNSVIGISQWHYCFHEWQEKADRGVLFPWNDNLCEYMEQHDLLSSDMSVLAYHQTDVHEARQLTFGLCFQLSELHSRV